MDTLKRTETNFNCEAIHYRIHGQEYASKQHGFARDTDFTCIDSTPDSVTHQIRSTEDTRKVYPFDFVLLGSIFLSVNAIMVVVMLSYIRE